MRYLLIVLIVLLVLYMPTMLAAQDTTSVELSDNIFLKVLTVDFGLVMKASIGENTMIEVEPQISIGLRYALILKSTWGLNIYGLLSTANEKMYPTIATGVSIMNHQIALGYYFGPITGAFDNSWQERLRVLVTFSLR